MYLKGKKCKTVEPNSFRIGIQDFPYDRKLSVLLAREREEFQNSVITVAICEEWEIGIDSIHATNKALLSPDNLLTKSVTSKY